MSRSLAALLLAAAVLLAAAGCGGRPEPALDFTVQQEGSDLVLMLKTTNFRIPQDGHAHLRINDGPEVMFYSTTYRLPNVKPGTYRIQVYLSDVRHNELGLSLTKEIEVK